MGVALVSDKSDLSDKSDKLGAPVFALTGYAVASQGVPRTRFFKDFFGDWEAAPPPRHKTDDRSREPSALTRAHALQGVDINIIQNGEKSNDVSKVADNGGNRFGARRPRAAARK